MAVLPASRRSDQFAAKDQYSFWGPNQFPMTGLVTLAEMQRWSRCKSK